MISFNGNILDSAELIVNKINKFGAPKRDLQTDVLSYQDGFVVSSHFWRSRKIVISGTIAATSNAQLASTVDTLKKNLSGVAKNLDVDYGGDTRRYIGTLAAFESPESFYHISYIPYTAEFLCAPFGYATSSVNFSSNAVTASPKTESLTITGSVPPRPIITVTFNTETGASACSFENTTTGDIITITYAFTAADILTIDTMNNVVSVNGTKVDFTGPIPLFALGTNDLVFTIPATARNVDIDIDYTPTYL